MGAPYYGAYFVAEALAGASAVAQLDAGTTSGAAYAIYNSAGVVSKVLLYNSDYYVSGTRPSQSFTLTGISSSTASAKRLTAAAATSRQDQGSKPTVSSIDQIQSELLLTPPTDHSLVVSSSKTERAR